MISNDTRTCIAIWESPAWASVGWWWWQERRGKCVESIACMFPTILLAVFWILLNSQRCTYQRRDTNSVSLAWEARVTPMDHSQTGHSNIIVLSSAMQGNHGRLTGIKLALTCHREHMTDVGWERLLNSNAVARRGDYHACFRVESVINGLLNNALRIHLFIKMLDGENGFI